jgi:aminopeptidase-like protein
MTPLTVPADKTLGQLRTRNRLRIFELERTMQPYRNLAGNSGVEAFDILRDGIKVRFVSGGTYFYDYRVPGGARVEEMKQLARAGRGLSTYIAKFGAKYAEKID